MWRETDFLVTDLYPADVAEGKHVLLIYTGDTLEQYLAIKADKARLIAAGEYEGEAREEFFKQATARNLIKRAGTAEEVARGILFTIENDFVTGTTVDVDGGALLP